MRPEVGAYLWDADVAARIPELEKFIGMRNIIAHEYGDIDYELVEEARGAAEF